MGNWPALLVAPTLALTNLSVTYALVTPSCARQSMLAPNLASAASLAGLRLDELGRLAQLARRTRRRDRRPGTATRRRPAGPSWRWWRRWPGPCPAWSCWPSGFRNGCCRHAQADPAHPGLAPVAAPRPRRRGPVHGGGRPAWGAEPWVLALLALALLLYAAGLRRLWPRSRQSRGRWRARPPGSAPAGWRWRWRWPRRWTRPAAFPSPPTWSSTNS
jgi:hypothetical protein